MYVRDDIRCEQIDLTCVNEIECIAITITLSQQMSFNVIGVYRPPSSDVTFYEHFKNLLKKLDTKKECIVLGDFNLNWTEKATRKKLKALTNQFELTQLIDGPTRITNVSKTQIDLIFSNKPERIIKSYNLLTGLSDHNMTLIARKLTKNRFIYQQEIIKHSYGIRKHDMNAFKEELSQSDWRDVLLTDDIDASCES